MGGWAERIQARAVAVMERETTLPIAGVGAPPAPAPSPELAALVEKCGLMWTYFLTGPDKWGKAEWESRREVLCRKIDTVSDLLLTGQSLTDYGWGVTPGGDWHRVGEAPPVNPYRALWETAWETWEQIEALLPAELLAAAQETSRRWRQAEDRLLVAIGSLSPANVAVACEDLLTLAAALFDLYEAQRTAPGPASEPGPTNDTQHPSTNTEAAPLASREEEECSVIREARRLAESLAWPAVTAVIPRYELCFPLTPKSALVGEAGADLWHEWQAAPYEPFTVGPGADAWNIWLAGGGNAVGIIGVLLALKRLTTSAGTAGVSE